MAEPRVRIYLSRFRTEKQKELLKLLNDKKLQTEVNTIIGKEINVFVPKKRGALRRSMTATPETISWGKGLPYARYQYNGQVYGPNFPIIKGGRIVAWRSRKGMKKYPTGRELGVPGVWKGWKFGYTKSQSHHHWDRYFTYKPKQRANLKITRILKRECKRRGLNK